MDVTPVLSGGFRNFLFRGNAPIVNKKFAYPELVASFSNITAAHNVSLPSNFFLLDLSFENPAEISDELVEIEWIKANPKLAGYVNWIIVGSVLAPPIHDMPLVKKMALNISGWNPDNLPVKMTDLRTLLFAPRNQSVVIYMHCEAGTDRTGEVSGAYYMR